MESQPLRSIDIAIELIYELNKYIYDETESKAIAKIANIEAWKFYKTNPNDIDAVAVFAITEAMIGNINKSINLFEDKVIPKVNKDILDMQTFILIFINYAEALMVNGQIDKALLAINNIKDLFDTNNEENVIEQLHNIYIFQTMFRIYFEKDLYSEILELSDITEQVCHLYNDDSKLAPKLAKMFVSYKLKNYSQLIIYFNDFLELIEYKNINPIENLETIFEQMYFILNSGIVQLSYGLTIKEKDILDGIKKYIYNYVENNTFNNNEGLNMIEDYDESISDELQKKYTYELEELLNGFNGSKHEEISTGEPVGREVW